ncbi:hypothetical protein [Sphingomonas psychrotolerans]|nr:hypothetical protein [Sphingomonas psychrotolerans]
MTGFAIALLFGSAFIVSVWAMIATIRPQLHRFAELFRPASNLPALPARLGRVTIRAVPARLPAWAPLRAAA